MRYHSNIANNNVIKASHQKKTFFLYKLPFVALQLFSQDSSFDFRNYEFDNFFSSHIKSAKLVKITDIIFMPNFAKYPEFSVSLHATMPTPAILQSYSLVQNAQGEGHAVLTVDHII